MRDVFQYGERLLEKIVSCDDEFASRKRTGQENEETFVPMTSDEVCLDAFDLIEKSFDNNRIPKGKEKELTVMILDIVISRDSAELKEKCRTIYQKQADKAEQEKDPNKKMSYIKLFNAIDNFYNKPYSEKYLEKLNLK